MQEPKLMNFSCVVLCPDRKARSLLTTVRSIHNYTDAPCIAMLPKGSPLSLSEEMKKICQVYRGGATYTGLINSGIGKIKTEWAIVIFAGTMVKPNFWRKYSVFLEGEKDIIYPITAGHIDFVSGSLNGLLIHSTTIQLVGKLPEIADINEAKLVWANEAIASGYRLKGLLGIGLTI